MSNFQLHRGGRVMLRLPGGSWATYSNDFRVFEVQRTRQTVTKPSSPGSPEIEQKAGAFQSFVNIELANNQGDTSGAWALLWGAQDTIAAEVEFDVVQGPGAVSASNPKMTGTILVSQMIGGVPAMGSVKLMTATFPARGVAGPITSE